MPGLFITFEGGEGSGKSTQLARLASRLSRLGLEPVTTREPGGTPVAEAVRGLLLDPDLRLESMAEAFLIEAARADSYIQVVAPALRAGRVLLCDRYTDSTLAYQGYGRGMPVEALRDLNGVAVGGLKPDLTLLFDLEASEGIARRTAAGKPNRIDAEPIEFHERVRQGFLALARAEPERILVIDARREPDEVERHVWSAVEPRIATLKGLSGSDTGTGRSGHRPVL